MYFEFVMDKGEVANTILNTKGKAVVPPFSPYNRRTGVI